MFETPIAEVAKKLLEAIRDVETSHEISPRTDKLIQLIADFQKMGLLANGKEVGAYVLRSRAHGGPQIYVETLATEIAFLSLALARECRNQYAILSPWSNIDRIQILQIVE